MNVVITGANRGLGFGFVEHYLAQGANVWACYRNNNAQLKNISSDRLHLLQVDIVEDFDVDFFPDSIHLLINNAGIYGPGKGGQNLDAVSAQDMMDVFRVDCVGAVNVVQKLKDRIIAAYGTIANVSSKMGSSADNSSGGAYAYRAAKAALVIVSKSMAIDLHAQGISVVTLHPGWVKTDMTKQTGLIDIAISVDGMAAVIANVKQYDLGAFIAYDGEEVPF